MQIMTNIRDNNSKLAPNAIMVKLRSHSLERARSLKPLCSVSLCLNYGVVQGCL